MKLIEVDNVQSAYVRGLGYVLQCGTLESSRNGGVLVAPEPVTTVYDCPMQRVMQNRIRNANPFFHLLESMWMLAGRDDVKSMQWLVKRMATYSDDGDRFHAAYGHRWRRHFGLDQIVGVIEELRRDITSRRAVISMWDPAKDLGRDGKDLPCNTTVFFRVVTNWNGVPHLEMTICNRSNDVVWGAYGANAVHMSVLMEFIARACGFGVGRMYQISNNYHVYTDVLKTLELKRRGPVTTTTDDSTYPRGETVETPLFSPMMQHLDPRTCLNTLEAWWDGDDLPLHWSDVFTDEGLNTLNGFRYAWNAWKEKVTPRNVRLSNALLKMNHLPDKSDWAVAARAWMERQYDYS